MCKMMATSNASQKIACSASIALAIGAGGALSGLETIVLLTVEETVDALRKAEQVQYRAPGE